VVGVSRRFKLRRNDGCPCGSGKKFKHCCEGYVDWNNLIRNGADIRPYLSIRGRNIYFANRLFEILKLDPKNNSKGLKYYKAAFTGTAVRQIYEAVMEAWPPDINIEKVLSRTSSEVSGLYNGDYELGYIIKGIVRHSIYANKILVIDPFVYPKSLRDEYNPIIEPDQYRAQTLKNANFWFSLIPWIDAGIVEIIRTPADFDPKLNWESLKFQQKKFDENQELKKAKEESVKELKKRHMEKMAFEHLLLSAPDFYIKQKFEELFYNNEGLTADDFLKYIHRERELDPDFLEPIGPDSKTGQLKTWTTGANYEIARITASITRSYLVTDLYVRWREIELDRESHSVENTIWSPFSKAVQNANLKYLNSLRLEHALSLRKEGRLERFRIFLHRVWKDACIEDPFDNINAQILAEELQEKVQQAEEEWKQIDRDLIKMMGAGLIPEMLAAGPLIASGNADFLAAAGIILGATNLAVSTAKRRSFPNRFPAAFFMKIGNDN
jgi:hypothetical protein